MIRYEIERPVEGIECVVMAPLHVTGNAKQKPPMRMRGKTLHALHCLVFRRCRGPSIQEAGDLVKTGLGFDHGHTDQSYRRREGGRSNPCLGH